MTLPRIYLVILISAMALPGFAQELPLKGPAIVTAAAPLAVQEKHLIPNAVGIQITPHGLLVFKNKLKEFLGTLGANIESADFAGFTQESQTTYSLNNLELPPDAQALLNTFRAMVSKWFVGFAIDDIRPGFQMGNSNYVAKFKRLSIEPDLKTFMNLSKTNGAVLDVDVDIQQLDISTDKVLVYDVNRKDYLQVGLDDANLKIAGGQEPLTIRMPIYVKIDPGTGKLQFNAVNVQTNFNQIDLDLKYKKLDVPPIAVVIGNKTFPLNQRQLQAQLDGNMKQILAKVRSYLDEFATQQLPKILNDKAEQYLAGTLEEVNSESAPGSNCTYTLKKQNPHGRDCEPLLWGLQLMSFNQNTTFDQKPYLDLNLQAYVEDNLNPSSPLKPESNARGEAHFNNLSLDQYDIGMSLNRGLINRFLSLSFDRGLFNKIITPATGQTSADDPAYFSLVESPVVDYVAPPSGETPTPAESYIKVHAKIQMPSNYPSGILRQFAVSRGFQMSADLIYKLRYDTYLITVQDPKFPNDPKKTKIKKVSGIGMFPWDVDRSSVQVDPRYIHASFFLTGTVNGKVADALAASAAKWHQADMTKPQQILPLPPQSLGNMMDVHYMAMDPTGNLMMYLNYSKNSWRLLNAKTIDTIQLSGLSQYRGDYLTVYYASAHGAAIGTSNDQVTVNKMLLTKDFQITGDSVTLPSVPFPRKGFLATNYIIMVVHPSKDFTWSNDPSINAANSISIDSESISSLLGIEKADDNVINYSFGSGN